MNQSNDDQALREQLISLLDGGNAHISFDEFVKDFPVEKCGDRIESLPYTAWQVLEHMRIAQWDILEFSRNADHVSPKWPKGYWPDTNQTGSPELWKETAEKFQNDTKNGYADGKGEPNEVSPPPETESLAKVIVECFS